MEIWSHRQKLNRNTIHNYLILETENPLAQLIPLNLKMLLLHHVAEILTIHLEKIFFWEDCKWFAVLVTKMVYLKVFEDRQWVQDSSATVMYIFHLAENISLQNVIHRALLLTNLFY